MKRFLTLIIFLILILGCGLPSKRNTIPTPIPSAFLTQESATATPAFTPSPQPTSKPILCSVTASVLNLREGSGTEYGITKWLDHQAILEVDSKDGNWYLVTTPSGEVGYVHSRYCKKKEK